jgi:cytochrome c5
VTPARGIALLVVLAACAHSPARGTSTLPADQTVSVAPAPVTAAAASASVDFSRDIRPILESRCQPCHFAGGNMYERLPFDQAATIRTLGPKLFTRIKADDEQALFRRFFAQAE